MSSFVGLKEYQRAEVLLEAKRARPGLIVHALITAAVSIALVAINIFVASEFPWSPFPVAGMSVGLLVHYLAIRSIEERLAKRQAEIESVARRGVA